MITDPMKVYKMRNSTKPGGGEGRGGEHLLGSFSDKANTTAANPHCNHY